MNDIVFAIGAYNAVQLEVQQLQLQCSVKRRKVSLQLVVQRAASWN